MLNLFYAIHIEGTLPIVLVVLNQLIYQSFKTQKVFSWSQI